MPVVFAFCSLLARSRRDVSQWSLTVPLRAGALHRLRRLATHHTATAETWLDVVAVTDVNLFANHDQLPAPGLFKYDLVFCAYRLHPLKPKQEFITYRNYRCLDMSAFMLPLLRLYEYVDAASIPWHEVILTDNVEEMVDRLNSFLLLLYDRHAPMVTKRVNKKPAP
ncbi:uncharacterized protein LOC120354679 [Nilaparvata lugens]|uniref:uncharacterized protein LOC120354679 n=1 Tax=Nilaparvata lugens TaxID=108931 RepID=UPI00193DD022|nr:uncharacterized protein LOC120354679 [Nilaparvata lugens]